VRHPRHIAHKVVHQPVEVLGFPTELHSSSFLAATEPAGSSPAASARSAMTIAMNVAQAHGRRAGYGM
jgi:hypothetical protein